MVPDVATGDRAVMLCLNCARKIVSPRSISKYRGFTDYLKFRGTFTSVVKLSFAKIDGIIGSNLPMSAYRNETWWSNSPRNAHAKAWLDAGWKVQEVSFKEGYVVFKKVRSVPCKRRAKAQIKKPFTPVPVRVRKASQPSKTKVSKLYARIKNLERQRTSLRAYRGSFKPRPKHEKNLFSPDKKLR